MTVRHDPPAGAPIWIDLMTSHRERALDFYTALFGWTVDPPNPEFGGYTNLRLGDDLVAGLMDAQPGAPADAWSIYLAAADTAATVTAADAAGATTLLGATPVGDLGTMAVVVDPGGAAIGMWQPGEHRGGVVATTGAPCHFELHTTAYDTSRAFYRDVFGWTLTTAVDQPDFRYTTYDLAPGENAGIMDSSAFDDDSPACWSIYFASDDVAASLDRVVQLGGSVVRAAEATPYGVLASAADPNGAQFKLRGDA